MERGQTRVFETQLCEWETRPDNVRCMGHGRVKIMLAWVKNTDRVFWSEPGCNSFVCVRDFEGNYVTRQGDSCFLVSVNGIGELRWDVRPSHPTAEEMAAVRYFMLTPKS